MAGAACTKWTILTSLGILLQSIGLYLFVMGFFPVKPALKGNSGIESLKFDCSLEHVMDFEKTTQSFLEKLEVRPQFHRIVLMVIDGLPAEFLLGRDGQPPSEEIKAAMTFTQRLLSSRRALGFHARAAPPTVTMPRLKAMTSGAIAGFLDVAFNFNTQAMLDDNLIGQLERLGWKMTMYGDETWLRLFPKSFLRQDGVSSFFVKDTVQVDWNVSRHLNKELARHDWDLLILHYLGLDHVGHLGGRSSSLMPQKLQEMDDVIEQLHESLLEDGSKSSDKETLLVVVSDHGMTHGGNHGGASFEETDALALFIRKRTFSDADSDKAFQVDLVPTLALLLGVPIPKNSVGVLLPQLFDTLPAAERLRALEVNSWQIMKLLNVRYPKSSCISSICSGKASMHKSNGDGEISEFCDLFSVAKGLHQSWRESSCHRKDMGCVIPDSEMVSKAYLSFLRAASDWLARGTTEKNTTLIFIGVLLILLSAVLFLSISLCINSEVHIASGNQGRWRFKLENWIAVVGVCGHVLSFNSSSLVEEEQFTLHLLVVTLWFLFLRATYQEWWSCQVVSHPSNNLWWGLLPSSSECVSPGNEDVYRRWSYWQSISWVRPVAVIMVLICARLLQGWHRGGVNWAHLPDIAKWLEQSDPAALLGFHAVSLAVVTIICCWLVLEQRPHMLMQQIVVGFFLLAAFLIELYNLRTRGGTLGHGDQFSIMLAQLVYALLGGITLAILLLSPLWFKTRKKHLHMSFSEKMTLRECQACLNFVGKVSISCWCLLQLLLQQPINAVPVLLLLLQLICCLVFFNLSGSTLDFWLKLLTLYLMGSSGHFGMGNTNTLATVDVAGAYIGLSQHSIVLSGLLAFVITYAAPLLYMLGALLMISLSNCDASIEEGVSVGRRYWLLDAIALSCSIPLLLSSVILVSFTLVMLLMQGHLFIWSVFSPKYIYVCFTVLSTYWGVILNAMTSLYAYIMV